MFPFFNIMICTLGVFILIGGTVIGFSLQVSGVVVTNASLQEVRGNHGKVPFYMEWNGRELLIHPSFQRQKLEIPTFSLKNSNDLENVFFTIKGIIKNSVLEGVLKCLKLKSNSRFAVILVRPSGFNNFLYLREFFLRSGLKIGYEPVGEYWKIAESGKECR